MVVAAINRSLRFAAAVPCCAMVFACSRVPDQAPPRATDRVTVQPQVSGIAVPVSANLDKLASALDAAMPRALWTIDKPGQVCAPSKKIKILFAKIKTPELTCRVVGKVTRGPMTIGGSGQTIIVTMPLHATVSAQDIGGVIKQETAQADARIRAAIRLTLAPDWSPRWTVEIHYDWVDTPHVDILGQRIEFTSKADAKLKNVIADLERTLPRELAKLHLREQVEQAWRGAFTSLQLNGTNPPVWMRISPRQLSYGGYAVKGHRLTLRLGMKAETQTFVGARPTDPVPISLPSLAKLTGPAGEVQFAIPVIADYRELEPVLARALAKRAQRPFDVPGLGSVRAIVRKVTVYGTTGGKIAVGLTFRATQDGRSPTHGTVWLTARPVNAANSRRIEFTDLSVAGVTDSDGASLLIKLVNAPGLSETVAHSLTQNFSKDYAKLLDKITDAIAEKHVGSLIIQAKINNIRAGNILATGQGIYLPVSGQGSASIILSD